MERAGRCDDSRGKPYLFIDVPGPAGRMKGPVSPRCRWGGSRCPAPRPPGVRRRGPRRAARAFHHKRRPHLESVSGVNDIPPIDTKLLQLVKHKKARQEPISVSPWRAESYLVELRGIEPLTSALRTRRSPI